MKRLSLILGSALALTACSNEPIRRISSNEMPSCLKPYDWDNNRKIEGQEVDTLAEDVSLLRRTGLLQTSPLNGWGDFAYIHNGFRAFNEIHGLGPTNACIDYSGSADAAYELFR